MLRGGIELILIDPATCMEVQIGKSRKRNRVSVLPSELNFRRMRKKDVVNITGGVETEGGRTLYGFDAEVYMRVRMM